MKLKVTYNDSSQRVLSFSIHSEQVVLSQFSQLVAQGHIYDFEVV